MFGIVGYGYVGKATHLGILKNQSVVIHDIILSTGIEILKDCQYIFICIPTSTQQEINQLADEIKKLITQNPNVQIIIRSTVPIGTCDKIEKQLGTKLIYIPEFLRERFWEEDCQKRPLIVGHNGIDLPDWLMKEQRNECKLAEAEMVKMFSNTFATVRIAFANIFYDLSQSLDVDYDYIKNMYFKVAHSQTYMEVPGHDGSRGFGGKCLPKDLNFIINSLDEHGLDSFWFKNIRDLNKVWLKKF